MKAAKKEVGLSNLQLQLAAPSIFATKPWEGVSKRYAFIPTIHVVEEMRAAGFVPVRAAQSKCRIPGKVDFTKHMIRFRSKEDELKYPSNGVDHVFAMSKDLPEILEVVLTNAHDRSAAYHLDAGMFRFICSNGMVISSANVGSIHINHFGKIVDEVLKGTAEILRRAPLIQAQVASWKKLKLDEKLRLLLAEAILINRYGLDDHNNLLSPVAPCSLLIERRPEDKAGDLWTTTNVIQENIMRGDVAGVSRNGRRTRTRSITSINAELDINRIVWATAGALAERFKPK